MYTFKIIDNDKLYSHVDDTIKPVINNTTRLDETKSVPLIKFPVYDNIDFIEHGFSTRMGGVSSGIYSTMNLTFNLEDSNENVSENFRRIGNALNIKTDHMTYSKQTHTTNVMRVDEHHMGMGVVKKRDYDNIDGLVTNVPGQCLVTSYADCVPLFFVDPVQRCIGASHSGWRGTVGNICSNTIELMKQEYGSNPKDIITFIGPSICAECYEISRDVADECKKVFTADELINIILLGKSEDKFQLNLQMANYYNMINAGICPENINISNICTCCNNDILFSHRATQGKRGILCGFIYIKE